MTTARSSSTAIVTRASARPTSPSPKRSGGTPTSKATSVRSAACPANSARLLRDLPNRVDGLAAPVATDRGSEEHRLFEAITSWLLDAAVANEGMVLVLDDLHWATKPTLLLTLHLLRAAADAAAPLMVLMTYRDTDVARGHPLFQVLSDLRQVRGVEQVPVDNLNESDVVAFMEARAGHAMDDAGLALGAALYDETEGNPFFVAEVLRHLVETDAIRSTDDDGRWIVADVATVTIPEGVRDVVGRRLTRLSQNANAVLTVAAVQGHEVDLDVLVALHDDGEAAVLDALDEAVAARLVEETGPDRYRFAHALVRTTLIDDLLAMRRRRLHLRIADALEDLHRSDVVALAYHSLEGADHDRAVRYGLAAAEEALEARAFAEAEDRFRQVLAITDSVAALCGLGECRHNQGNADFRDTLLDASRRAHASGQTSLLVRAVLANSRGMAAVIGQLDDERIELIELALDAVGPEASVDRACLPRAALGRGHFRRRPQPPLGTGRRGRGHGTPAARQRCARLGAGPHRVLVRGAVAVGAVARPRRGGRAPRRRER